MAGIAGILLSLDCEASITERNGESYHHYQRRMKEKASRTTKLNSLTVERAHFSCVIFIFSSNLFLR